MRADVLAIIPTYNEVENVTTITSRVAAHGVHVLVVDDGSPDGTGELADQLAAGPDIDVLHRAAKAGLGPAYAAGFSWGIERGFSIICEMDADLSHDPEDLPRLLAAVQDGADVVIGSRYVKGGGVANWPLRRRVLSRGGNLYARLLLGTSIKDMTGGYRAFTADALRRLEPSQCEASGYAFQIEMAWKAVALGLRVEEVPIVFTDRVRGESKMDAAIASEALGLIARWGLGRIRGQLPWPTDAS